MQFTDFVSFPYVHWLWDQSTAIHWPLSTVANIAHNQNKTPFHKCLFNK